jgi:hypothetical protein
MMPPCLHTTTQAAARAFVERYPHALSTPDLRKALDDGSLVTEAQRHTPAPLATIPPGTVGDPDYDGLLPRALLEPLIQATQRETVLAAKPPPRFKSGRRLQLSSANLIVAIGRGGESRLDCP